MIAPGTVLQNRYLVEKQIGQGGMGTVYVATDQRFGSTVALKETLFDDLSLRKAFEREAHLLHRLRHSALPKVTDHFSEGTGQFLVMEFIPGDDLSELLKQRQGAFPLNDVLDWADQLLDALDYLHTQEPSVVHRDIKPQNLKLMQRGQIVLLDFGLAKGSASALMSRVTQTGSVFGYSRNYAPLEQIQGTGTDPRSDFYSLGATLYHLLTGNTPPDALTRATAVLNGQPDPLRPAHEVHARVSSPVGLALASALALNSSQRPQTASEMRATLREARRQTEAGGAGVFFDAAAQGEGAATVLDLRTQLMTQPGGVTSPANIAPTDAAAAVGATTPDPTEAPTALVDTNRAEGVATVGGGAAARGGLDHGSVVTKVGAARDEQQRDARPHGWLSVRTLSIAASFLILVAVAAAAYTFIRQRAQTDATPQQEATPTPQAAQELTPERDAKDADAAPLSEAPGQTKEGGAPAVVPVAPRARSNDSADKASSGRETSKAPTAVANEPAPPAPTQAGQTRAPEKNQQPRPAPDDEAEASEAEREAMRDEPPIPPNVDPATRRMIKRAMEERRRMIKQRRMQQQEQQQRRRRPPPPRPAYPYP